MEGGSGGSRAGSETSSDSIGKSEYEGNEGIHSWCSGAREKNKTMVRCQASTGHCHSKTLSMTPRMVADEGSDFWGTGLWRGGVKGSGCDVTCGAAGEEVLALTRQRRIQGALWPHRQKVWAQGKPGEGKPARWDQGSAISARAEERSSVPSIPFPFPSLTGSEMGNSALRTVCSAGPLQAAAKTNGCCAVGRGQPEPTPSAGRPRRIILHRIHSTQHTARSTAARILHLPPKPQSRCLETRDSAGPGIARPNRQVHTRWIPSECCAMRGPVSSNPSGTIRL